jgi:integrase
LAYLKASFTKAVDWGMVSNDVLLQIRKVKPVPENNCRLRYLAAEEVRALIGACAPHLRPVVIVAANTGMRRGEILKLKWSQVDLRHGFILLDNTKNGHRREIPINTTVREVFESISRGPESEYVFPNRYGDPYRWLDASFKTACRKAEIHDFKFHDLRHTAASHLIMSGIDITTVKELLGHKTLAMTMRYAHLAPSHKVKAVEVLGKRLASYEDETDAVFYNRSTI